MPCLYCDRSLCSSGSHLSDSPVGATEQSSHMLASSPTGPQKLRGPHCELQVAPSFLRVRIASMYLVSLKQNMLVCRIMAQNVTRFGIHAASLLSDTPWSRHASLAVTQSPGPH